MKIKQKVAFVVALIATITPVIAMQPALAAGKCGNVDTAIISCDQTNDKSKGVQGNGVWGLLLIAINILTAGVGIAAVGGLILAGITYATASNDQNKIVKAKEMIYNVVLGIVMFALMWSFLQYLIPGGVFKG